MTERQIRSVAVFFLFALLDERAALRAAEVTIAALKARVREDDDLESRIAILRACVVGFDREKKRITRGKLALTFESGWRLPDHTELAPWVRFHKDADEEELLALIFSRLMGFSDTEIALALGISEGTARYRIGRAVRHLGAANRLAL